MPSNDIDKVVSDISRRVDAIVSSSALSDDSKISKLQDLTNELTVAEQGVLLPYSESNYPLTAALFEEIDKAYQDYSSQGVGDRVDYQVYNGTEANPTNEVLGKRGSGSAGFYRPVYMSGGVKVATGANEAVGQVIKEEILKLIDIAGTRFEDFLKDSSGSRFLSELMKNIHGWIDDYFNAYGDYKYDSWYEKLSSAFVSYYQGKEESANSLKDKLEDAIDSIERSIQAKTPEQRAEYHIKELKKLIGKKAVKPEYVLNELLGIGQSGYSDIAKLIQGNFSKGSLNQLLKLIQMMLEE